MFLLCIPFLSLRAVAYTSHFPIQGMRMRSKDGSLPSRIRRDFSFVAKTHNPENTFDSALFKGASTLVQNRQCRNIRCTVMKRLRTTLLAACMVVFSFGAQAGATTTVRQSLTVAKSLLPCWKGILKVSLAVWGLTLAYSNYQVKKRQAKMATSEWSRYARYPSARGRAIFWLLVQQAMFVLASNVIRSRRSEIRQKAGRHFSDSLLRLGPLYIKLAQIVSCRKNMLGPEWIDAMATLQDQVPANTGQDALDLAYTALDGGKEEFDQLFVEFDSTPLAAASLGQVHKAKLRSNGDLVAVKLQRPFLRQIYDQDLKFLTTIAQWMDKMPSASKNVGGVSSSWTKIFRDAEEILYREIDYRDEADNGIRFAQDFGLTRGGQAVEPRATARNNQTLPSAADWIRVPYVYQNVSNERMLVMEFVPSIKVTNKAKLGAANVTAADQLDLADALARAYLRQFCCNLFFSTDPHPGNVGIEITESGTPRLVLYDFGQAATLTQNQADGILQILEAIIDMNVDRSIEAFQKMGVLVEGADLGKVRAKVAENYRTGKVKANRKRLRRKGYIFKDSPTTTQESSSSGVDPVRNESTMKAGGDAEVLSFFSLPAEYAFVARAISQMDGVGKGLDPEFDFISNSAPYIVEIKGADMYLKEEAVKFLSDIPKRIARWQGSTIPEMYEKWIDERQSSLKNVETL